MSLPTASKIERVMACPASHALPQVETEPGDEAVKGTLRHAALAWRIVGSEATPEAVDDETMRWLEGLTEEDIESLRGAHVEMAYAWDVLWGEARIIGRNIGRAYGELRPTEIAGSADYVLKGFGHLRVVDLKTGRGEVTGPSENRQLLTLALMAARADGWDGPVSVELLLAPDGGSVRWQSADVSPARLAQHEADLVVMHSRIYEARADVEAGRTPRHVATGSHCTYCPAQASCPERQAMVTQAAEKPMTFRLGWEALLMSGQAAPVVAARDALQAEADAIDDALRAAARKGDLDTGGGTTLGWRTYEREVIDASKAWPVLVETLGQDAAREAVSLDTSKAGVERGVSAALKAGVLTGKKKDAAASMLTRLREAGAMAVKQVEKFEEHKR